MQSLARRYCSDTNPTWCLLMSATVLPGSCWDEVTIPVPAMPWRVWPAWDGMEYSDLTEKGPTDSCVWRFSHREWYYLRCGLVIVGVALLGESMLLRRLALKSYMLKPCPVRQTTPATWGLRCRTLSSLSSTISSCMPLCPTMMAMD